MPQSWDMGQILSLPLRKEGMLRIIRNIAYVRAGADYEME